MLSRPLTTRFCNLDCADSCLINSIVYKNNGCIGRFDCLTVSWKRLTVIAHVFGSGMW